MRKLVVRQMVFVSKLLLVKVSCNMGVDNTITASSLSSGAPKVPLYCSQF